MNRTGLTLANLNSAFFLGSINSIATSLPLNLLYFKGTLDKGQVLLDWATPSTNTAVWFTVQRSKDGSSWDDWQRLQADGIGTGTHYYSTSDPAPYSGTSFYRLQQVDATGNSLYSSVLSFSLGETANHIMVYPVPATDHLTVSFPGAGNFVLQLLNSLGQKVRDPLSTTGNAVTWQLSGLPAGPYFIRIIHDGVTETRTVLIR